MASSTQKQLSNWTGWVFFAGIMMMLSGFFQVIAGLTGLLKHNWYVVSTANHLLVFNYQAWGWIDLIVGAIIILAGMSVLHGSLWARIVGIILAVVSSLAAIASINEYPIWSIIVVTVDVLIIYALAVHGAELKD